MRITGGRYKGRKILCPPGVIRPTMDRMRESLFAVLGDLEGSSFLDLYAGSGAVGIEAASRGAEPVVFVEKDRGKRPTLVRNLSMVKQRYELFFFPVEHYLRREKRRFDVIFLDPPFRQKGKSEILKLIACRKLLAEGGVLIIHIPREEERTIPVVLEAAAGEPPSPVPPGEPAGRVFLSERRRYGGSLLLFYRPPAG
jgi:16S rRNA (guanine966-N2)-methyltransferase